ncbi:hypothetical protein [Legionella sp.]|uniref:hypothetical protein n=1 Tax=Legionella sp. TaxID=459 RepID=UPI003C92DDFC
MSLVKSAFNGIGSGAGVAWPFFGILFTLVGGSIGGSISLMLGSIAIGLFFTVSVFVFYFSYQQTQKDEQQLQDLLRKNERKLSADIGYYINSIREYLLSKKELNDFDRYFPCVLNQDLQQITALDKDSPLFQFLAILSKEYEQHCCIPSNQIIIQRLMEELSQPPVPYSKIFISAFFDFVGTFGSIAGCSAGVSGLLNGMGIFSSFAAFPLLGWGIIGIALTLGLFSAYSAMIDVQQTFKKQLLNQTFKDIHQQLSNATLERNLDAALNQATNSSIKIQVTTQSIFSSKERTLNKFRLNFSSFFKACQVDSKESFIDQSEQFDLKPLIRR